MHIGMTHEATRGMHTRMVHPVGHLVVYTVVPPVGPEVYPWVVHPICTKSNPIDCSALFLPPQEFTWLTFVDDSTPLQARGSDNSVVGRRQKYVP